MSDDTQAVELEAVDLDDPEAILARLQEEISPEERGQLQERLYELATKDEEGGRGRTSKSAIAAELIENALADGVLELFPSIVDETAYSRIAQNGRAEVHPVRGGGFSRWLRFSFFDAQGTPLHGEALSAALAHADMRALQQEPRMTFVRTMREEGAVVVDIGGRDWTCWRITAGGIVELGEHPVPFVRSKATRAFASPTHGRELVPLLEQEFGYSRETAVLIAATVVMSYVGTGALPVIVVHGEQGSGKSVLCRLIRSVIDPSRVPLRRPPREDRDLATAARTNHMLAYDNLSGLTQWLSDYLASIATGSGNDSRALFTDFDEIVTEYKRVVLLNGIESPATMPDLLDRTVLIGLPTRDDAHRDSERKLEEKLEHCAGELMGAVLRAVQGGLQNMPTTPEAAWARLVDATTFAIAASGALGAEKNEIEQVFRVNREQRDALVLESSTFASAVMEFAKTQGKWKGTTSELLAKCETETEVGRASVGRGRRVWPESAQGAASVLTRELPVLRRQGVEWVRPTARSRTYLLTYAPVKGGKETSAASPASLGGEKRLEQAENESDAGSDEAQSTSQAASPQDVAQPSRLRAVSDADDAGDAAFPAFTRGTAVVLDEPFPLLEGHALTCSLGDGPELRVEHVQAGELEQRDRFRAFLTAAHESRTPLAVDLEATGKDPHAAGFAVRLWSVSDGTTAFVVDARDERSRGLVHALLDRYPRLLVHNGYAYDLAVVVRELGIDVAGVSKRARELRLVDTMLLSRLVHPDAKRIGLKEMSTRYFGDGTTAPDKARAKAFRSTKSNWATIDAAHPALIAYAGADAALTQRLHERLRPEAGSDRQLELEHRVAAICLRTGLRGFAVDADAAAELETRLRAEEERLEQALAAREIVAVATDAGRTSIVEALELEGLQVANGKLDRSVLAPLAAAGSVVARDVLQLRTAARFRSLYARMFARALEQDGRLHAYARSLAATTGRMAISDVPLQTVPKEIELGAERESRLAVRDVLVADPGDVVGSIDYRAMELRLAAGLSGDVALRAVVEAGDPHLEVARALFGAKPTSRQRDIAKTVNFAAMYGMQAYGLSVRLGISIEQAQSFLDAWWARFPQLKRYAAELSDDDRSHWGRRLPVEAPRHARLNHRVQAAGRDIFCAGLLRLEEAGLVDQLALPLHDEYVLAVPERGAHELVARAGAIVSNELGGVPLPVDANVGGRSWGSAK